MIVAKKNQSHHDLSKQLESLGFEVEMDSDNNESSFVAIPGDRDFGDRIIAEIRGDAKAVLVFKK